MIYQNIEIEAFHKWNEKMEKDNSGYQVIDNSFRDGPDEEGGIGVLLVLVIVGGYVALVPTISPIPSLEAYNEKRAIQVGVLVLSSSVLFLSGPGRRRWLSVFLDFPLLARWLVGMVLSLGILSSALAPAPFYAFLEVGHFSLLFVTAGIVASAVHRDHEKARRVLLGALALSGLLYAIYFAVGYGMHLSIPDIKLWPEGGTNYANIRIFNQYQTWTLPLFAGVFLSLPKSWRISKDAMFGVVALWWALVFASNVRGTIVAVLFATVVVGLLFRSRAKNWLAVQVAGLLLGVALYYLLFSTGKPPPVTDKFGQGSPTRLWHWAICLEMMTAHPLLGAGPMHFAWPPYQFTEPASPHSALFQWLAEWGIPSTLAMGGLTIWAGWSWIKRESEAAWNDEDAYSPIGVSLVAALLAGAAHSMVSGLIVTPLSQMLLVVVGGWAWGRFLSYTRSTSAAVPNLSHVLLCVLLVASLGVVGSSLKDLPTVRERRLAFLESVQHSKISPRYWHQGFIGVRNPEVTERARRER